jgi:multicomponent Na+:H+ antiporter subunit B
LKVSGLILVTVLGAFLIYGTFDFPPWGDPLSPANQHVSPYYIEKTMDQTSVPNIVTAVLADYRSYDTMFETCVIFTAGIACIFLLRTHRRRKQRAQLFRHRPTGITLRIEKGGKIPKGSVDFEPIDSVWVPDDLIVKTCCRLIIPFIQIFALYVIAHGHYSPGGGFQGGVILGAAIILFAVSFDLRSAMLRFKERSAALFCALGVLIYAGTGIVCMFYNVNFLDYKGLAAILGVDPVTARSHGILIVEVGVGIAVMAVMVSLYYNLSSAGRQDEGL